MKVLWIIPCKPNSPLDMLFARHGASEYKKSGIEVLQYDFTLRRSALGIVRELVKLRKVCRAEQIDLVHAQFGSTTALLALLSGYSYVVTFRGTDLNGDVSSPWLANLSRRFLGQLASFFAQEVILVSAGLGHHLLKRKFNIIPSGTKTELFVPMDVNVAKEKLGLDLSTNYLAFATGGGRRLKRQDLAQEVVERLRSKGHQVALLPIWDVPHLDVPYYINSSAAVLLTSEREGSPNIVREALSCGVPVCAFEVGDTRKWLELDPQSKVVAPGDVSGLVSAVEKVLSQKPAHVRRVDVEMFSVAGAVSRTAKIYLGLKSSH